MIFSNYSFDLYYKISSSSVSSNSLNEVTSTDYFNIFLAILSSPTLNLFGREDIFQMKINYIRYK